MRVANFTVISLSLILTCVSLTLAEGANKGTGCGAARATAEATASIMIAAPPKLVWDAVHVEREQDPDIGYSKVLADCGNTKFLEQMFINVPNYGNVVAVTRQVESPEHQILYTLVRSDKFKDLSGGWELMPLSGGRRTRLILYSSFNLGVPTSTQELTSALHRKIQLRLLRIKERAEAEQVGMQQYKNQARHVVKFPLTRQTN